MINLHFQLISTLSSRHRFLAILLKYIQTADSININFLLTIHTQIAKLLYLLSNTITLLIDDIAVIDLKYIWMLHCFYSWSVIIVILVEEFGWFTVDMVAVVDYEMLAVVLVLEKLELVWEMVEGEVIEGVVALYEGVTVL